MRRGRRLPPGRRPSAAVAAVAQPRGRDLPRLAVEHQHPPPPCGVGLPRAQGSERVLEARSASDAGAPCVRRASTTLPTVAASLSGAASCSGSCSAPPPPVVPAARASSSTACVRARSRAGGMASAVVWGVVMAG
jgi:hypothetical protein